MIVLRENCSPSAGPVVATIGFFDGVHCGHRFLLSQTKDTARRRGGKSMAVTFSRHPSEILCPGTFKELLTDFDERCSLLGEAGIDYCAVLDFTLALSKMLAKDFMSEYLRRRLNVSVLVVGYDHSFGHDKESTFDPALRLFPGCCFDYIMIFAKRKECFFVILHLRTISTK